MYSLNVCALSASAMNQTRRLALSRSPCSSSHVRTSRASSAFPLTRTSTTADRLALACNAARTVEASMSVRSRDEKTATDHSGARRAFAPAGADVAVGATALALLTAAAPAFLPLIGCGADEPDR